MYIGDPDKWKLDLALLVILSVGAWLFFSSANKYVASLTPVRVEAYEDGRVAEIVDATQISISNGVATVVTTDGRHMEFMDCGLVVHMEGEDEAE